MYSECECYGAGAHGAPAVSLFLTCKFSVFSGVFQKFSFTLARNMEKKASAESMHPVGNSYLCKTKDTRFGFQPPVQFIISTPDHYNERF